MSRHLFESEWGTKVRWGAWCLLRLRYLVYSRGQSPGGGARGWSLKDWGVD